MVRLGLPPTAITRSDRGAPQWPPRVVGSITHCEGYRAAAVAQARRRYWSLAAGLHLRFAYVLTYLYNDGESYVVMDDKTFDQIELPAEKFGDAARFSRARGDDTGGFSFVAGVRTWF